MEKKACAKTLRRFDLISQSCEVNSEFKARDAIPVNVTYFTIVFFVNFWTEDVRQSFMAFLIQFHKVKL